MLVPHTDEGNNCKKTSMQAVEDAFRKACDYRGNEVLLTLDGEEIQVDKTPSVGLFMRPLPLNVGVLIMVT